MVPLSTERFLSTAFVFWKSRIKGIQHDKRISLSVISYCGLPKNKFAEIQVGRPPVELRFGRHPSFGEPLASICARIILVLCRPAPASNCEQEKQRGSVEKTQRRNCVGAGSTQVERIHVKSSEHPKNQRKDHAGQAQPITYCGELFFHTHLPSSSFLWFGPYSRVRYSGPTEESSMGSSGAVGSRSEGLTLLI